MKKAVKYAGYLIAGLMIGFGASAAVPAHAEGLTIPDSIRYSQDQGVDIIYAPADGKVEYHYDAKEKAYYAIFTDANSRESFLFSNLKNVDAVKVLRNPHHVEKGDVIAQGTSETKILYYPDQFSEEEQGIPKQNKRDLFVKK